MEKVTFVSFDEFWPFYLSQHKSLASRQCHFAGVASAVSISAVAVLTFERQWFLFAIFVGYAWAWFGHYYFEKNRPATFRYPFYSLLGDFKMFWLMLQGKLV